MIISVPEAISRLGQHQIAAIPTETVYGLAGDAASDTAVQAIYALKGRPAHNPLIVHVQNVRQAEKYALLSPLACRLADAFWPGALTMVLPRTSGAQLSTFATAGLDTVAVRCPAHPLAQDILAGTGRALVAPSANRSGRLSPTLAIHVEQSLGKDVPVVDGGACPVGVESTIIQVTGEGWRLLRPGSFGTETLAAVAGCPPSGVLLSSAIIAPGQLNQHYAPALPVRLDATKAKKGEALLGFGHSTGCTLNLSESGNLDEAARNLFRMLHQLDTLEYCGIAVMPIPMEGTGIAINDRLVRAATRCSEEKSSV